MEIYKVAIIIVVSIFIGVAIGSYGKSDPIALAASSQEQTEQCIKLINEFQDMAERSVSLNVRQSEIIDYFSGTNERAIPQPHH